MSFLIRVKILRLSFICFFSFTHTTYQWAMKEKIMAQTVAQRDKDRLLFNGKWKEDLKQTAKTKNYINWLMTSTDRKWCEA